MKLYIHYNQKTNRGPGKVVQNLIKGLDELGVELVKKPNKADYLGCLQHPGNLLNYLPEKTLMGPNIFVLPNEEPILVEKMKNFIVPSNWVMKKYKKFPQMKNKNISVWSVGIDTEEWKPNKWTSKDLDCFIYCKNVAHEKINKIENFCKEYKLNYEKILYGSYEEKELKNLCKRSRFCILLTDTESQGIAYMEILSMNVPCLVIDKNFWNYQNQYGNYQFEATSVPYFNEQCGKKITNIDSIHIGFQTFLNEKNHYEPRAYILNNHTLVHGASEYVKIISSKDSQ